MLTTRCSKEIISRKYLICVSYYYEARKITKWKEGRGKCVLPLVLQAICFVAALRQLAKSSSAPIFSPLKRKFCNICLLLSEEGMCQ